MKESAAAVVATDTASANADRDDGAAVSRTPRPTGCDGDAAHRTRVRPARRRSRSYRLRVGPRKLGQRPALHFERSSKKWGVRSSAWRSSHHAQGVATTTRRTGQRRANLGAFRRGVVRGAPVLVSVGFRGLLHAELE